MPATPLSGYPIKVLLIDSQNILGKRVRALLADEPDMDFLLCPDHASAVPMAGNFSPTVILFHPGESSSRGLDLLGNLQADARTKTVPVILVSLKEGSQARADAFAAGASDCLGELPGRTELLARIRHHSRIHVHLLQRNDALAALEDQKRALQKELGEASDYVSSLFPAPINDEKGISADWRYLPSSSLGGDIFSYLWLDDRRFILELLDVCGHGIGAALLSISVINTLRSRNALRERAPRPPSEVLSSLNKSFPMENNNQMYFTMWFGIYDTSTRELTYSSGGHPPAIALAPNGAATPLSTPGLMVGGLPEATYTQKTFIIEPGTRLFLFSDGCYEVKKQPGGELMSLEDFTEILRKPGQTLDQVIEDIRRIQGKPEFVDDFSLVEFTFA